MGMTTSLDPVGQVVIDSLGTKCYWYKELHGYYCKKGKEYTPAVSPYREKFWEIYYPDYMPIRDIGIPKKHRCFRKCSTKIIADRLYEKLKAETQHVIERKGFLRTIGGFSAWYWSSKYGNFLNFKQHDVKWCDITINLICRLYNENTPLVEAVKDMARTLLEKLRLLSSS